MILFVGACSMGPYRDYTQTESGMYVKYFGTAGNSSVEVGDIIFVQIRYYNEGDSLIFNSRSLGIPMQVVAEEPTYKGDIMEGLLKMGKGDTANFVTPTDSFITKDNGLDRPMTLEFGTMLKMEVVVIDVMTTDELEEILNGFKNQELIDLEEYLVNNDIQVEPTESGLYYIEIKPGDGRQAADSNKLTIHYLGYTLSGKFFNSSYSANRPLQFRVGQGAVIPAWDEAFLKMRVNGKSRIIVPSKLAYGRNSVRGSIITPYSALVYDIELLLVEN